MTSHTPGPWTAHPPTGGEQEADGDPHHWVVRAPGKNGSISFQLCQMSSYRRPEDGPDTHLIAAAPDLLAALQGVQTMANCGQLDEFLGEPWLKAVTAAIAKATA